MLSWLRPMFVGILVEHGLRTEEVQERRQELERTCPEFWLWGLEPIIFVLI